MRKRVQKAYGGAFGALEHFGQMISAFARVADVDGNPNPNPDPDPDPSPSPSPNPNPNPNLNPNPNPNPSPNPNLNPRRKPGMEAVLARPHAVTCLL